MTAFQRWASCSIWMFISLHPQWIIGCHLEVTQSENHRMVDIVDLLRLSSLVPLLNQGHLELVAQDHAWSDLKNLNKWRLQNLLGQPVPVLDHLNNKCSTDWISYFLNYFHCLLFCQDSSDKTLIPSSSFCIRWVFSLIFIEIPSAFSLLGWTVPAH